MALLKRRYGAHLDGAARSALAARRPYPSGAALGNPLTRSIARRIADAEWQATCEQLDFDYALSDEKIGGVPCVRYRVGNNDAAAPTILYLHAGGFVSGSGRVNASAVLPTCRLARCEAIAVDYSLAPEARHPTQLDEIERVYRALISGGRAARDIVLLGDSAGGALAVSALYRWRRNGLPAPAGVVLLSPILDAFVESDTHHTLRSSDPLFVAAGKDACRGCFKLYAGEADFSDPEVSPLAGDPAGFPPTLIHVGTREVLLGDSARFAEKARRAGVDVRLRVFDGMFHLFHQHWSLAEAKAAHQDIADFIDTVAR